MENRSGKQGEEGEGCNVVDLASPTHSPYQKKPNLVGASSTVDKENEIFYLTFHNSIIEVAQILMEKTGSLFGVPSSVPTRMPEGEKQCSYVISLDSMTNKLDCNVDSYGRWKKERSILEYLAVEHGNVVLVSRSGNLKEDCADYEYRITRSDFSHPDLAGDLVKRIFKVNRKGESPHIALIAYKWMCDPYDFVPSCHGNAKKKIAPYFR